MNLFIGFICFLIEAIYYATVHKDPDARGCLCAIGGIVILLIIGSIFCV